jgi:hypothetical protein
MNIDEADVILTKQQGSCQEKSWTQLESMLILSGW